MKFNSFLKAFLFGFIVIFVISCDKDFNEIGADFVDNDHYNFTTQAFPVKAYSQPLTSVQTNNLPINALGYYNNEVFGRTTANFVTQLELGTANPTFIKNPATIEIDSVYLHVPYFSTLKSTDANGDSTYELDSIYGSGKLKLEVFRSNYYLRNLDANPVSGLLEQQSYFSDQSDIEANLIAGKLNYRTDPAGSYQNEDFEFSPAQIKFYKPDGTVKERLAPGIYMDFDADRFETDIIRAGASNLLDNNAFKNYYRGLFFKVTPHANNLNGAALSMLNFAQGKIVIVYKDQKSTTDTTEIRKTMVLNMKGYTVSLLDNQPNGGLANNAFTTAMANSSPSNNDEKLYLKGGPGSMAIIDLFDGLQNNNSDLNNMRDWLINEANLVFTIDHTASGMGAISDSDIKIQEPNRIYLYDFTNNRPVIDYYYDTSTNTSPKFNKLMHSGIVQKVSVNDRGTKYKIRITNYVRNLVKYGGAKKPDGISLDPARDSTNVKLGLVVTENINVVTNGKLRYPFTYTQKNRISGANETKTAKYVPTMSVMNPLGTVLYGSNASVPENLRLKLEIIYTKPD